MLEPFVELTWNDPALKITDMLQGYNGFVIFVMQWLNEERLVQRLVEMIDPSETPEVLLRMSASVCACRFILVLCE